MTRLRNGRTIFNAVEPDVAFSTFDRETAFWHLMFGAMAVILGRLVHWSQARTGTVPGLLGLSLLALCVAALVLMPVSGFLIVLPQAVVMILVSRRERTGAGAGTEEIRRAAG